MDAINPEDSEKIIQKLMATVLQGEEMLKIAAGESGERVRELRRKLAIALNRAKAVYQSFQNGTVAAAKSTDQAVRDHPYAAIGIALSLGLLIGLLVAPDRLKKRRRQQGASA